MYNSIFCPRWLAGLFLVFYGPVFLHAQNVPFDPSFGENGRVFFGVTGGSVDVGASVVVQPDGKIVVGGTVDNTGIVLVRYHSDGRIDEGFGMDGIVRLGRNQFSYGSKIALQPDGKILVAGTQAQSVALVRLLPDGQPDPGFGEDGVLTFIPEGAISISGQDLLVSRDGALYVLGFVRYQGDQGFGALVKLTDRGALDASFGEGGMAVEPAGLVSFYTLTALDAVILPDGSFFVTGSVFLPQTDDDDFAYVPYLIHYTSQGFPDEQFGAGGFKLFAYQDPFEQRGFDALAIGLIDGDKPLVLLTQSLNDYGLAIWDPSMDGTQDLNMRCSQLGFDCGFVVHPGGMILAASNTGEVGNRDIQLRGTYAMGQSGVGFWRLMTGKSSADDVPTSLTIQPDGKSILTGFSEVKGNGADILVARFNEDGSLDASFGEEGTTTTNIDTSSLVHPEAMAVRADGRIYVGASSTTNDDFNLFGFTENGSPDPDFGTNGHLSTDLGGDDYLRSMSVQSNGRVLAVGRSSTSTFVVGYRSGGVVDETFGTKGYLELNFGYDRVKGMLVQPDDKFLLYTASGPPRIVRFDPDGAIDTSFGTFGQVYPGKDLPYWKELWNVVLQPDDSILMSGTYASDFWTESLNPDGTLNTGFGGEGYKIIDVGSDNDVATAVYTDEDGNIILVGSTHPSSAPAQIALVKINPDGSLVTDFGDDGISTTAIGASYNPACEQSVMLPGGNVLCGGKVWPEGSNDPLAHLTLFDKNGSPDLSFGSDGNLWIDDFEYLIDMVVIPNGDVLILGAKILDQTIGRREGVLVRLKLSSPDPVENPWEEPVARNQFAPAAPNPFSTQTAFSVTLSETQHVSVVVYDVLGWEVSRLFDGVVPGKVTRPMVFDAAGLSNGIYLIRVEGQTFTASQRVIRVD